MADAEGAIDAAAGWLLHLLTLRQWDSTKSPQLVMPVSDEIGTRLRAVVGVWGRLDPLARQPIADAVFPRDEGFASESAWSYVLAPRALGPAELGFAEHLGLGALDYFRMEAATIGSTAALNHLGSAVTVPSLRRAVSIESSHDLVLATSLFEQIEANAASEGLPIWFSYPDDLAVVQIDGFRVLRVLMARRGDAWFVLVPPTIFDAITGRAHGHGGDDGDDDGGESAGVREPRNPIAPVLSDHASRREA